MERILVIGAGGQVGVELVSALRKKLGNENVIASDIREIPKFDRGPFVQIDAMDKGAIARVVKEKQIDTVYLMAAMLSATGEKFPDKAWSLNMTTLLNLLECAREGIVKKIFWPSSIAVFGPSSPRYNTPQNCVMNPTTVYGISKLAGEQWCQYYFDKYGVDVRSIRYPGLIGSKSQPGGGTTDYAVHIFHEAISKGRYNCFLSQDRTLPMMHMDDAIKATIDIMSTEGGRLSTRMGYNIAGLSFSPKQLAESIKKLVPEFQIEYMPDIRDELAASWPESIDDSLAKSDWGWHSSYDLSRLTKDMLHALKNPTLS